MLGLVRPIRGKAPVCCFETKDTDHLDDLRALIKTARAAGHSDDSGSREENIREMMDNASLSGLESNLPLHAPGRRSLALPVDLRGTKDR